MRLSTKSRYGLRAIFDIAYHCGNQSCQIQDISRRQNISQRYLEQIFQSLKKAGILRSKRGPQGGYILAKDLQEITVRDIINATEGDLLLVECATSGRKRKPCVIDGVCATQTVWEEAAHILDKFFATLTLQDLCSRGEKLGIVREKDQRLMYHI
ncbi:MAG: Rrf2 family transcriptional regulator [Geobacter sp.]|nr:Rrf2 family transcriptional regulator [Geobacter sp.]